MRRRCAFFVSDDKTKMSDKKSKLSAKVHDCSSNSCTFAESLQLKQLYPWTMPITIL